MKKFYLGLVSLMLIMLHSCSQDELESTPINEPQAIKVVNIIDGNISTANTRTDDANYATMALQFSSEAEVQELLDDLKEMSIDERLKFTDSLGFISLEKLLRVADEELDSLGASATSEADFRVKHAAYYYLGRPTDVFSELAYVWTDMTLKDANGTATYDKNKAYKCQINMSYNNQ